MLKNTYESKKTIEYVATSPGLPNVVSSESIDREVVSKYSGIENYAMNKKNSFIVKKSVGLKDPDSVMMR